MSWVGSRHETTFSVKKEQEIFRGYESQLLRSRFTRDKDLSARNLTTNFLVNILICSEKPEISVRNRYTKVIILW